MKIKTSLYLDEEVIQSIRKLAKENKRSFASMINFFLSDILKKRRKQNDS